MKSFVPIYIIFCLLFMDSLVQIILSLSLLIIIMLSYAFFSYLQNYEETDSCDTDNLLIKFIKDCF